MSSTPPDDTRLRVRAVLSDRLSVVLAVCLVVAAVGAGLVYTTHVDPGTETETRTVSSLTVESEYAYSAEVTRPNPVFATGTVLDDRNTFFTRISPELDVEVATRYAAPSAEDVTVEMRSTLVLRNVGEEGTVYWRETEPLTTETASSVAPDETVTAAFDLNGSAVDARVASIDEQLGASPGETETLVRTDIAVDGTVGGVPTTRSQTVDMTIDRAGETYTVDDPGLQSDTTEQTQEVTVERSYGLLRSVGGPALLLVGLAAGGGLWYARRKSNLELTAAEREYLSYRDDRSEFDEWITALRLPASVHDRPEAKASSLRDLVDFAIDNGTGVVEDPTTGRFHAVAGECIYTYRPPDVGSDDEAIDSADDERTNGTATTVERAGPRRRSETSSEPDEAQPTARSESVERTDDDGSRPPDEPDTDGRDATEESE